MKNKLLNFIAVLAMILTTSIAFGQAPEIGTAANFVLFSSDGAVVNTGKSQITGKVGSNNGPITGFGNVNGGMHTADGVTSTAATDVLSLYNELNSTTPDYFPSSSLGNGQTLNAGVYSIAGATTLNNELILDAQGNSGAVFIFKIGAAFSAASNSKVTLKNGAQACNVFWKIEGLVELAAGTSMKGTIVVNNAAINLRSGNTLEGRVLTTTGAVTVEGVLAYTPTGCGSPTLEGPMAPTLGSVGCYGIFSSDGPITNSGVSNVTGDVGTNVGLTTGFDDLLVTGEIHPKPDGSTEQAADDLLIAYNYLNGLEYDIELLYPAQLGANLVLTPHTYLLNGATTLTDTLFLNAQGNADAVFVIKIYGAISAGSYSTVVLTNGAKAENVYWMINGAVDINDYTTLNGTIISQGAVNLYSGTTINGRVLTGVGAIETNAVNIAANISSDCGIDLGEIPILLSPSIDSLINSQSVTLEWKALINADTYILDVSLDSTFSNKLIDGEVLSSTTKDLMGLLWDQTYYWRVKAVVNGIETEWSNTWKFTVTEELEIGIPVLLSPDDNTVIDNQSLTISWEAFINADTYILDVSLDSTFTNKLIDGEVLTSTTKDLMELYWEQTYYWRVKAVVNGTETEWSTAWKFTVTEELEAGVPVLISPADNNNIEKQSVTLRWEALNNADYYILDVALDASFSNKLISSEETTSTSRDLTGLSWDQTYYWRVKAVVNGTETEWSTTWNFSPIEGSQRPDRPVLTSPVNGATHQDTLSITFTWMQAQYADTYEFDLSINSSFSALKTQETNLTGTSNTVNNFSANTQYYWRVRAVNEDGKSDWSIVSSFTTLQKNPASVKEAILNGKEYNLSPNPAEDILSIKVSEGHLELNELIVYNISGREVLRINNDFYNVNQGTIDISNLQTGVYYIKLISNKENTTVSFIKK